MASARGHVDVVRALLARYANFHMPDNGGNTPLAIALARANNVNVPFNQRQNFGEIAQLIQSLQLLTERNHPQSNRNGPVLPPEMVQHIIGYLHHSPFTLTF